MCKCRNKAQLFSVVNGKFFVLIFFMISVKITIKTSTREREKIVLRIRKWDVFEGFLYLEFRFSKIILALIDLISQWNFLISTR